MRIKLSKKYLQELFEYNPKTGKLFWKKRPVHHFNDGKMSASSIANCWNGRWAGKEAFTVIDGDGYNKGKIDGIDYSAHRVIFALMTGKWPENIDHDNRKRHDNRWENLKESTHYKNSVNKKKNIRNKSGVMGVSQKSNGRWKVTIGVKGKRIGLGVFSTKTEAIRVRRAAEIKYEYHPKHGKGRN